MTRPGRAGLASWTWTLAPWSHCAPIGRLVGCWLDLVRDSALVLGDLDGTHRHPERFSRRFAGEVVQRDPLAVIGLADGTLRITWDSDSPWVARPGGVRPPGPCGRRTPSAPAPSARRCGAGGTGHVGDCRMGCRRSKYSVSPTLSLSISCMVARISGGTSRRSPSRASASDVK